MSVQPPEYEIIRADDGLTVRVQLEGMTPVTGPGGFRTTGPGRLVLILPPQHVVEWSNPTSQQPFPILTEETRVAFTVPAGTTVPLTVPGLLQRLTELEPATTVQGPPVQQLPVPPTPATAARLLGGTAEQRRAADPLGERERRTAAAMPETQAPQAIPPEQTVTGGTTTHLQFPSRLDMTTRPGATRWSHSATPKPFVGRSELWHTRLAVRRADGRLVEKPASIVVQGVVQPGDGAQTWKDHVADEKIQSPLRESVRQKLVQATKTKPAIADQVMLSPAGAWLDIEGDWPEVSWRHLLTMGRDMEVRTTELGMLYPLGVRALRVDAMERVLPPVDGRAAKLVTTTKIVVLEKEKLFEGVNDISERLWPWRRVEVLTRVATGAPKNFTNDGKPAVVLLLQGAGTGSTDDDVLHELECRAVDRGGRVSTFELPLIFVPSGGNLTTVDSTFNDRPAAFRTVHLRGQVVSVVPPRPDDPDGSDVVAQTIRIGGGVLPTTGLPLVRPYVQRITGRVAAVDRFVDAAASPPLALEFTDAYGTSGFDGGANKGQTFLSVVGSVDPEGNVGARPLLDLAKEELGGGLAQMRYELRGVSRSLGPVGGNLSALAQFGTTTPDELLKTLGDQLKIFGAVTLKQLLGTLPLGLTELPALARQQLDGLTTRKMEWSVDLFRGTPAGQGIELAGGLGVVRRRRDDDDNDLPAKLTMTLDSIVDPAAGAVHVHQLTKLADLELAVRLGGEEIVVLPMRHISFASTDGKKPDVDIDLARLRFGGVLAYVATLARLVPEDGFHDPPALDVRPDGVTSSFSVPIPSVAIGMFALENISLGSSFDLPFTAGKPALALNFAEPHNPFRVTVAALSGGGHLQLALNTDGLQTFAGSLEFGASLSVNLGVAKGSVSAMGGVSFLIDNVDGAGRTTLTAYLYVRGELRVLSILTISVEVMLSLEYVSDPARLTGRAELAVRVKLLFFKKTVRIAFERTFLGANSDPTFAELMASAPAGEPQPWDTYCTAFAAI